MFENLEQSFGLGHVVALRDRPNLYSFYILESREVDVVVDVR
jgi:hypothetical protein